MSRERSSGVLLHVSSLPSEYGIGDLGPGAHAFVDFLRDAGQTIWQMLPLGPTGYGDSPYQTLSAFAGNPFLISPDYLLQQGLVAKADLQKMALPAGNVDFGALIPRKNALLKTACSRFQTNATAAVKKRYALFCKEQAHWLDDWCLFAALKEHHDGKPWTRWPKALVHRQDKALASWSGTLKDEMTEIRLKQFLFSDQWRELHRYATANGVQIVGDIPIFLAHDSCEVWSHQEWFHLDASGQPTVVAGVPPDYFSKTGQRWGNPLFDWKQLKKENYSFWVKRFTLLAEMFDIIRIDHFRGFASYWEIPATEKTAIKGTWQKGPGAELFRTIEASIGTDVPIIAEDLGIITPDVTALFEELGYPGMAVLQFGFDALEANGMNTSTFLPHRHLRNQVVYTGTHDNDTVQGWWAKLPAVVQDFTRRYLNTDGRIIHRDMVRAALSSVADRAIFPMQDLFGLGEEGRMNQPGKAGGNWQWRFKKEDLSKELGADLLKMTKLYNRTVVKKLPRKSDSALP
jgi:4-alpha-glucanotransferase